MNILCRVNALCRVNNLVSRSMREYSTQDYSTFYRNIVQESNPKLKTFEWVTLGMSMGTSTALMSFSYEIIAQTQPQYLTAPVLIGTFTTLGVLGGLNDYRMRKKEFDEIKKALQEKDIDKYFEILPGNRDLTHHIQKSYPGNDICSMLYDYHFKPTTS